MDGDEIEIFDDDFIVFLVDGDQFVVINFFGKCKLLVLFELEERVVWIDDFDDGIVFNQLWVIKCCVIVVIIGGRGRGGLRGVG